MSDLPIPTAEPIDWTSIRSLLLIAEVLSPSTARQDRFAKRRRYQEAGVPMYWIVDPDRQQVEVWTPTDHAPRIERERLVWHPTGAAAPLSLTLPELFQPL